MKTIEIFEKVNLVVPLDQRHFFSYLEDTIKELECRYGYDIYYDGYDRLRNEPEGWETDYGKYFVIESNGFVKNLSETYVDNKVYEETEKENPLVNIPPPRDLADDIVVKPLYHIAIIDNILFMAGCGETYKNEFLRKSDLAHRTDFSRNTKCRRFRRARW